MPELDDIHFGAVDKALPEWRDAGIDDDDSDDDEPLAKTPDDVVEMLGFDPLEFEDESNEPIKESTQLAAVAAALESVETPEEAKAILRTLLE